MFKWQGKVLPLLLAVIFVLLFAAPVQASEVTLRGKIVGNRFLVPMRDIFEALGTVVDWDGNTRTVTGSRGDVSVSLKIDSKIATVNGKTIELDVPATIIENRTFVPTRFVSESLGANVSWDGENRVATITQAGTVIKVLEREPIPQKVLDNKSRLLNLSDSVIREAIYEGKKGYSYVKKLNDTIFKLPVEKSTLFVFTPEAYVQTPFFTITRASVLEDSKYRELTTTRARELISIYNYEFPFELKTYGTSIVMGDTFHFVLEQNGKIIQPSEIIELTQFAERTSSWPDAPAYYKVYTVYFPVKEINFDKPATLVFIYAGKEMSARFIVDFNKLK